MDAASQGSLFEADRPGIEQAQSARARMREMIARLKAAAVPYWRDESGVVLDDGAFQRAMRLVPPDEAQALWADFDAQMERLYAIWAAGQAPRADTPEGEAAPGP